MNPLNGQTPFLQHQIAPHTLGLTMTNQKLSTEAPPSERSATAFSLRDKLDRSRFEFNAVRRKASGSLKEKSLHWWEQRRNRERDDRVEEGWI
jgi:hypothetical protein